MSIRSERIKALIKESNQTYQELEKTTGIKKSSLQRYASGVTSKIPLDVIEKLSKAFDVSQEYLMGWEEEKKTTDNDGLTDAEKELLRLFNAVPENQRQMVLQMIRAAISNL